MVCHEGAQPSTSLLRIHAAYEMREGPRNHCTGGGSKPPTTAAFKRGGGKRAGDKAAPPRGDSTQPLCPKRTSRPSGYDQHYPLPGSSSAPDGEHGEKRRGSSLATGLHGQAESSAQAISRAIANDDHPEAEPGTQELGEVLSYDGVEATV